jgi:hypothetical protein
MNRFHESFDSAWGHFQDLAGFLLGLIVPGGFTLLAVTAIFFIAVFGFGWALFKFHDD